MKFSKAVFIALLLMPNMATQSFAMFPSPAKLVEEKVSPACLTVQPAAVAGPLPGISITNHCSGPIVIQDILTAMTKDRKTPAIKTDMTLVKKGDMEYMQYSRFWFSKDGQECNHPLANESSRLTSCRNVIVFPGDAIEFLLPYGTYYAVYGSIKPNEASVADSLKIRIEGRMIIPGDVVALFEWAQTGDTKAQSELLKTYEGEKIGAYAHLSSEAEARRKYEDAYFWYRLMGAEDSVLARAYADVVGRLDPKRIALVQKRVQKWKATYATPSGAILAALQASAEKGDASAQLYLGLLHMGIIGVKRDYHEAAKWIRMAAMQNETRAQYQLGSLYAAGNGVRKDYSEAYYWRLLSDNTSRWEQIGESSDEILPYLTAEQRATVLRRVQTWKAARAAKVAAQAAAEEAAWLAAAEKGDVSAQVQLGVLYRQQGTDQGFVKARKWFHMAANQGNYLSQFQLVSLYRNGLGGEQDYAEAYFWSLISDKDISPEQADKNASEVVSHLTPEQRAEVVRRVKEWKPIPSTAPRVKTPN